MRKENESKGPGKGRVFSVAANGGVMETVYTSVAIEDVTKGEIFTKEAAEDMLAKGETVFSDEFYYANNREALAQWVTVEADADGGNKDGVIEHDADPTTEQGGPVDDAVEDLVDAEATSGDPNEIRPGDLVINNKSGKVGIVSNDLKRVEIERTNDTVTKSTSLTKQWQKATDAEFGDWIAKKGESADIPAKDSLAADTTESQTEALEKSEPAIEGQPVLEFEPLTKKEQARLDKLESEYEKVDTVERAIPFEKGRILNEIRSGRLFRHVAKTFGEYALARFGITREYAQNLAQISGIPDLLAEVVDEGMSVALSVNVANEVLRDTNKLTQALGLGKVEFELVKPVIRNTLALMVDVAPKDADGSPVLTPRFINSFNEVLATHLTDGVVEIDGKQMTVVAAAEAGLLNNTLRSEVLQQTAEQILTQGELVKSEVRENKDRQESNIPNAGGSAEDVDETKYYKGKVPTLGIVCSKHGDTEIVTLGAGKFQTRCGCRWHMDATKGELIAYEVDDKPVRPSK